MYSYAFTALAFSGWLLHSGWLTHRLRTARRDPLTGLHTRSGWSARAERLLNRPGAAVLLVDLDHFKQLNDTHGHAAGDAALTATAQRLAAWCHRAGLAGRIGGDEFTAITTHATAGRLDDLARLLNRPVPHNGALIPVTASIGTSHTVDLPVPTLSDALSAADQAMYTAKGHTRRP
ncbi:GGDEF domain-containing protein [Streptomyces bohaiensis]|uniref:GGDEF domain-containing protein n=1 Tax=Streptomyces bohaiensis TaxID=1431344 RepID=A0ABX1CB51_9ACTN|nr:GGDEF domain-containing protein [Streptomyces bohaiensis]NJQ14379.1 GGDEF domain-containing protein [Streptomyces bohaiensis]